jgi:predicted nicotinamide N-methyase
MDLSGAMRAAQSTEHPPHKVLPNSREGQAVAGLEPDLRQRFETRTERFEHGDFAVELLLPRSADALIDTSEFNHDERLPYWANLWPSARALARSLLDRPPPGGPVLELGCGVALPSLALRARGAEVLATDYYEDALLFARANAERNGLPPLETALVDWRELPTEMGRFSLVLAADVLYERRNAEDLAAALPALVAPGGSVLLADPGRTYAGLFRELMKEIGWGAREVTVKTESALHTERKVQLRITIFQLTFSSAANQRPPPNA